MYKRQINGQHPFQDKFDEYIKPLYDKDRRAAINSTIVVNTKIIKTNVDKNVCSVGHTESASPSLIDSTAPPSTHQLLANMKQFESLYPKY